MLTGYLGGLIAGLVLGFIAGFEVARIWTRARIATGRERVRVSATAEVLIIATPTEQPGLQHIEVRIYGAPNTEVAGHSSGFEHGSDGPGEVEH